VDEVRRRGQQEATGHRGRKSDPLYGIRTTLRAGPRKLTDKQQARLTRAIATDERHEKVHTPGRTPNSCTRHTAPTTSPPDEKPPRKFPPFPTCPIPETKRLDTTQTQWKTAFLACPHTPRTSNDRTETINSLIELRHRIPQHPATTTTTNYVCSPPTTDSPPHLKW
jgi:transposase